MTSIACSSPCVHLGQDLGGGGGGDDEMAKIHCDDEAIDVQSKPARSLPQALGDAQAWLSNAADAWSWPLTGMGITHGLAPTLSARFCSKRCPPHRWSASAPRLSQRRLDGAQAWLLDAVCGASPAHLSLAGGLLVLCLCTACLRGAQHRTAGLAVGEAAALQREVAQVRARLDSLQAEQLGREQWRDFR